MEPTEDNPSQGGLTDEEKRANVVRLAFGGDEAQLEDFCQRVRRAIPEGSGVVLRGSAVTGKRWADSAPFVASLMAVSLGMEALSRA